MKVVCLDLFCGAGGASTGVVEAAQELGLKLELIAINHWPVAIATHRANYPWARYICARVDQVRRSGWPGSFTDCRTRMPGKSNLHRFQAVQLNG